jgi:hypothetical protein
VVFVHLKARGLQWPIAPVRTLFLRTITLKAV